MWIDRLTRWGPGGIGGACLAVAFLVLLVVPHGGPPRAQTAGAVHPAMPDGRFIRIGARTFTSLKEALANARDYDDVLIGPGSYQEAGIVKANWVRIIGAPGVKVHGKAARGKGAFVVQGDHTTIENIECFDVMVSDNNGVCVRLEGRNLTLRNVYFHHSQGGLLTGRDAGTVTIENSRFEHMGRGAFFHGVYVGGGKLLISKSSFLATRNQGHEITSRAETTIIEDCVIASMDAEDSRLIDLPNGGVAVIRRSVLLEGPNSVNYDLLSFGVEGISYDRNSLELDGNIIVVDLPRRANLVTIADGLPDPVLHNNVVIGDIAFDWPGLNLFLKSREEAGLAPYPALPDLPGAPAEVEAFPSSPTSGSH